MQRTFYTIQEVADMWKVNHKTVRRQGDLGLLKGYRISQDWRYTEELLNK